MVNFIGRVGTEVRKVARTSVTGRKVALLMAGTAAGQAVLVAAAPVLTRLYSPSELGVFGSYSAVLSVAALAGSLRFEVGIPLAVSERRAEQLFFVCLVSLLAVTCFWTVAAAIVDSLGGQPLSPVMRLAFPIGVLFAGTYNVLTHWAIRTGNFNTLSRTRIYQALTAVSIQIVGGLVAPGAAPLIAGDIAGRAGGTVPLAKSANLELRRHGRHIRPGALLQSAWQNRRFPFIVMPSSVINTMGIHLPVVLLGALYGTAAAGWFALAQRTVGIPMYVVASATAQVYLGEASRAQASGSLVRLFDRTATHLLLGGVLPGLVLAVFGDTLFATVFGQEWAVAGRYAQLMTLAFLMQLVVSPVSQTLTVMGKQGFQAAWDVARLGATIAAFVLAHRLGHSATFAVGSYGIAMAACYGGLLVLTRVMLRVDRSQQQLKV